MKMVLFYIVVVSYLICNSQICASNTYANQINNSPDYPSITTYKPHLHTSPYVGHTTFQLTTLIPELPSSPHQDRFQEAHLGSNANRHNLVLPAYSMKTNYQVPFQMAHQFHPTTQLPFLPNVRHTKPLHNPPNVLYTNADYLDYMSLRIPTLLSTGHNSRPTTSQSLQVAPSSSSSFVNGLSTVRRTMINLMTRLHSVLRRCWHYVSASLRPTALQAHEARAQRINKTTTKNLLMEDVSKKHGENNTALHSVNSMNKRKNVKLGGSGLEGNHDPKDAAAAATTTAFESKAPDERESKQQIVQQHKRRRKRIKPHRYKKFMMPMLMAYKMKFFTLIPVMISGLLLLTGSTGVAGFFFALFLSVLSIYQKTE